MDFFEFLFPGGFFEATISDLVVEPPRFLVFGFSLPNSFENVEQELYKFI